MMLIDDISQARPHDMGVHLGGRNVGMPEHGLHAAQVRATLEKVGREAVPQDVGDRLWKIPALRP